MWVYYMTNKHATGAICVLNWFSTQVTITEEIIHEGTEVCMY